MAMLRLWFRGGREGTKRPAHDLGEAKVAPAVVAGRPEKGTLGWFIAAKMTDNKDG